MCILIVILGHHFFYMSYQFTWSESIFKEPKIKNTRCVTFSFVSISFDASILVHTYITLWLWMVLLRVKKHYNKKVDKVSFLTNI